MPTQDHASAAAPSIDLHALADALDAHGIRYQQRGHWLRADCPVCGTRRTLIITELRHGLGRAAHAYCGCRIVDIAAALDVPPHTLLVYRRPYKTNPATHRDAHCETKDIQAQGNANAWGLSRTATQLRRGNLKAVERVAENMDRRGARLAPGEWLSYDTRRAATELGMQRTSVRRALLWLVARGILAERQLPAPGKKIEIETKCGGKRPTAKSGVKQYRPLTEEEQIKRLARRGPA